MNLPVVAGTISTISLPFGPIWLLHTFYLVSTALMLVWYLRFQRHADAEAISSPNGVPTLTIARPTSARPTRVRPTTQPTRITVPEQEIAA